MNELFEDARNAYPTLDETLKHIQVGYVIKDSDRTNKVLTKSFVKNPDRTYHIEIEIESYTAPWKTTNTIDMDEVHVWAQPGDFIVFSDNRRNVVKSKTVIKQGGSYESMIELDSVQ